MKTALVTGATGFIGGHVVRALVAAGWRVHAVKRSTSDTSGLKEAEPAVAFHDIDRVSPDDIFSAGPFDAVCLLATSYGRGNEPPSETLGANLLAPLRLLERAVAAQVPAVLHADTCFTPDYQYLRPYTLSKKQFAQWGRILCDQTATRFVNLVLQHPYGPGDRPAKFLPGIIRECLESTGNISLTAGEQRKDFVYVGDVAAAFLAVLAHLDQLPTGSTDLECGTGRALSIRELVETVHRLTGSRAKLDFGALPYRANEIMLSEADTIGLRALGWEPRVSLEDGLRATLREDFGRG
ncbi:MAG TPA: NAD(P)-dependent oxidoreductase [Gemmata sp.]|nr:NAD(P)-dependent oxidoreductase [Gemmata sp.]